MVNELSEHCITITGNIGFARASDISRACFIDKKMVVVLNRTSCFMLDGCCTD